MKNFFKIVAVTVFLFLVIPETAFAQGPPPWAPAHGYRAKTRYVYFPDQNMYYDLRSHNYMYLSGPNWVIRTTVPKVFVGINLGRSAQVELDFYDERPYRYNTTHVVKYKKGKKAKAQKVQVIEVHHNAPQSHGHGNGHGNGKGKGKGKH